MPPKNSLAAFKKTSDQPRILQKPPLDVVIKQEPEKRGRKPKTLAAKESEVVALKLTPAEKEALEEKAGLVPVATFLKHYLRTKTNILD